MVKVKYGNGDVFAVPLQQGGFGVGVVARAKRHGVVLGYFFGPRCHDVPSLDDVAGLESKDAVYVATFGHLGLRDGKWPVIGPLPKWDPELWPMPVFIRRETLTGRAFRVYYDENDPNKLLREVPVAPGEDEQGPLDGLGGAEYTEAILSRLLAGENLS